MVYAFCFGTDIYVCGVSPLKDYKVCVGRRYTYMIQLLCPSKHLASWINIVQRMSKISLHFRIFPVLSEKLKQEFYLE